MTFNDFLNTSIISLLFFLAVLAFSKRRDSPTGYPLLSIVFIILLLLFADELLESNLVYKDLPILIIIFQPVLYALAPTIYFAVRHLTTIDKKLSPGIMVHLIPYLLMLSLYVLTYDAPTPGNSSSYQVDSSENDYLVQNILLLLFFIQIGIYLFFSIRHLKRYIRVLPIYVSDISGNDFHWLYKSIIGLSLIACISFIEVVFEQMHLTFYFLPTYLISFLYIGLQLTKQKNVFPFSEDQKESVAALIQDQDASAEPKNEVARSITDNEDVKITVRKQVISEEKMAYYKEQLLALMENEKPYLDSEITLPKLGKMLLLNTYQTSYLINNCFGENFYTFINRYRLEECKRRLLNADYDHLSILGIAFDSGFNSKTTFNTSFKKSTGLSPKEFKEKMNKGIAQK